MHGKLQIDHAIVDVLIVKDNKFLLVEEGKPGREGLYNFPGGHVDAYESLFTAAVREVREETGYQVELTGVVGIYQAIYNQLNISGPVFSAKIVGGSPMFSAEHPSQKWVTEAELIALAKTGKLFTKYPPFAANHYITRGAFPLDIIASYDYRQ